MERVKEAQQYAQKLLIPKSIGIFLVILLLQLAVCLFTLRYFSIRNVQQELENLTRRVAQELKYENGKWDTSLYASDPETPHPSGSSGFSSTLYIISADGFVIERNVPIAGILDSSDFSHLMAFQRAQTITNITNETWRVLSKPLVYNGKTVGVIMVSVYNPDRLIQESADVKLLANMNYIDSKIAINNGVIDTSAVDIRHIDYDISFEVVSTFNQVILNNGRMPTYIDKSYVYNEIKNPNKIRTFKSSADKKTYLVVSQPLYDSSNNPIGVVLTGRSINFITDIFVTTTPFIVGFTILSSLFIIYFITCLSKRAIHDTLHHYDSMKKNRPLPTKIFFNKTDSILTIDDKQISIPYASNQYYLIKTIFTNIKKRFEVDDLLLAFGQDGSPEHWRKVYDAMILINKKVEPFLPVKLIELRDKTYHLNPQLYSAVKQ